MSTLTEVDQQIDSGRQPVASRKTTFRTTAHFVEPAVHGRQLDERPLSNVSSRLGDRLVLTVSEAANRLGVGRSLMYELIASGQVESIRIGRLRRIPLEALSEYVTRQRRKEPHPDPA
jgi:excisionase family DNA binding protein